MTSALEQFFDELDRYPCHVPLNLLTRRVASLNLRLEDVEESVEFDEDRYRRNLLYAGRCYHALVLCWRPGQRSPIHNHQGSSCAVRVLKGVCTETVFQLTPDGLAYPTHTRQLHYGEVCGSFDSDIHQVSNLAGRGQDLITLHIYSPPLIEMATYSLTEPGVRKVVDPIFGLHAGAGI